MPAVVAILDSARNEVLGPTLLSFAQSLSEHVPGSEATRNVAGKSAMSSLWTRQSSGDDTVRLYGDGQRFATQILALTLSTISVLASLVAFYWFARMRRRFRHKLIMMLLLGSLIRSLFFMIFGAISIANRRAVPSGAASCQVSGFMVQFGTEMNDFAALFIAIHSALQVFKPQVSSGSSDGLYNYRFWVFGLNVLVPLLMSALAFVNPSEKGYLSQGAFCSLPIRPIWYRLALAWIPRYLIWIVIVVLAFFIYAHVGFEFKAAVSAGGGTDPDSSLGTDKLSAATRDAAEQSVNTSRAAGSVGTIGGSTLQNPIRHDQSNRSNHDRFVGGPSTQQALTGVEGLDSFQFPSIRIEQPVDQPQRTSEQAPDAPGPSSNRPSITLPRSDSDDSTTYHRHIASPTRRLQPPPRILSPPPMTSHRRPTFADFGRRASQNPALYMANVRQRIHRQLRLLFVYPAIYIVLWIIPFILHCMQYNNYYAANPPISLVLLAVICLTSMSFVDVLVFTFREKPWKHIPTSDKSFLGSFYIFDNHEDPKVHGDQKEKENPQSTSSSATAHHDGPNHPVDSIEVKSPPSKRTSGITSPKHGSWLSAGSRNSQSLHHSGHSTDAQMIAADRARERLRQEQAERREANLIRSRANSTDQLGPLESPRRAGMGEEKMWWEKESGV